VKERDPIKGHKFAFDICTFERVYHLACETGEERKVWIDTLNTLLFEEPRKQVLTNLQLMENGRHVAGLLIVALSQHLTLT
jgi:hypothetical protein